MRAIILSAGQGRRLLPLTAEVPKSAVLVNDQSVLEWQLQEIAQCAIDEVVVVTGFAAQAVEAIVANTDTPGVRTVHNPFYALSDNLGTCWIARAEMTTPFVIINGDTLFEAAILQKLLDQPENTPITLATDSKQAYDEDDMKIISWGDRLRRVGKKLDLGEVNGESIGMMKFNQSGARLFSDRVETLMRHEDGLKRWYLSVIDELAQDSRVGICPIVGLSWCEIDDDADLKIARDVVNNWPSRIISGNQASTLGHWS
jgi:choline kinase